MSEKKAAIELDHPCKKSCSGWQQGFEKGQKNCPRCGDLFYDPKTLIQCEKQRAADWEEVASKLAEELKQVKAERDRLREILATTKTPLNAAMVAACVIQAVKDGNWEGGDYFDRLRALRHDMFCGHVLGSIEQALAQPAAKEEKR
jgi:uncharacterized C2H2 Zn-finger protein